MRRTLFALLFSAGCIAGSPAVQRDDRLYRALAQQERWTQDALAQRPTAEQLDAIRNSDYAAVGRGRAELKRLLQAADRGTWIRDTTAELMRDDNDPRLVQQFERGGRLRADALGAADELAGALAEAKGGLTLGDLRPGFEALRKAQASEDRLSRMPVPKGAPRPQPAPLPIPRPFITPAARVVSHNPELTRELDRLAGGRRGEDPRAARGRGPRQAGAEAAGAAARGGECAGAGAGGEGSRGAQHHPDHRQRRRLADRAQVPALDHAARGRALRPRLRRRRVPGGSAGQAGAQGSAAAALSAENRRRSPGAGSG